MSACTKVAEGRYRHIKEKEERSRNNFIITLSLSR